MSEEEQAAFGKMVKKGERHIGGVMVIGYAGLILAHLIKGKFYKCYSPFLYESTFLIFGIPFAQ